VLPGTENLALCPTAGCCHPANLMTRSKSHCLSTLTVAWRWLQPFLQRDALHKRGLCRRAVSVCLSVTFVYCIKTSNHILKLSSRSDSHTILVFPYQTLQQYSDDNPPPIPQWRSQNLEVGAQGSGGRKSPSGGSRGGVPVRVWGTSSPRS